MFPVNNPDQYNRFHTRLMSPTIYSTLHFSSLTKLHLIRLSPVPIKKFWWKKILGLSFFLVTIQYLRNTRPSWAVASIFTYIVKSRQWFEIFWSLNFLKAVWFPGAYSEPCPTSKMKRFAKKPYWEIFSFGKIFVSNKTFRHFFPTKILPYNIQEKIFFYFFFLAFLFFDILLKERYFFVNGVGI